jgi:hypothetical protein
MNLTKPANAQNIFFSYEGLRKYFALRTIVTTFLTQPILG